MSETNKGISLVIMILSIILLMIVGLFVYWEFFTINSEGENINFFKEGNLMINNPGFMKGVWYLSYEFQGSPANSIKLSFDKDSVCKNETNLCSDLISGERVEIRGIETDGEVLVKELRKINLNN
jgi:hypothetical protein